MEIDLTSLLCWFLFQKLDEVDHLDSRRQLLEWMTEFDNSSKQQLCDKMRAGHKEFNFTHVV